MPRPNPVDWKLILVLASAGVPFAALTILGLIDASATRWMGLALPLAIGALAGYRRPERAVAHGFLAAFLAGLLFVELQALFLPLYFANNPEYRSIPIPFGLPARFATAVLGPINAVIAGVIAAATAWVSGHLARRFSPGGEDS